MNQEKSIEATKKGFEASFGEGNLYNRQTQDSEHLNRIIEALHIKPGDRILDLGTGSGYVALEIAKRYREADVIGLDIVEETLTSNRKRAEELQLHNISFVSYNGMKFPFADGQFDVVVSRYVVHHIPDLASAFEEISRVLKPEGYFLVADPTPNTNDVTRFVDDYMRMKPDGHIKYYTKQEFEKLGTKANLQMVDAFQTEITFPRLKETAYGYDEILKKHSEEIVAGYKIHETNDGKYIFTTQKVWNILFEKDGNE